MCPIIICPHCRVPQSVVRRADDVHSDIRCRKCGGRLPALPPTAARPLTILWIDDDPLLLGVFAPLLEKQGYRVLVATDGAAGIAIATRERVDLILLDVVMPSLTGFEVCQQLRADPAGKETPIVLLTALEDAGAPVLGKKVGATATLRKPFQPEYLIEFLGKVLARKDAPPAL